MLRKLPSIAAIAASLSLIPLTGCDLDVGDLNNPGIDDLVENPTRAGVSAACTGLLIGNRRNRGASNGYTLQLGVMGREAYNFDAADPRYFGELLEGSLQKGGPFGGNFWAAPYANIRLANTVQTAAQKVADFSAAEKAAISGFSKTIEATDLLEVVVTHDTNGAVIDTDRPIDADLAPIVAKDAAIAEIAKLLDEGAGELARGGDAFPFALSTGYAGFNKPATFLTFNRAIRARVAAYAGDYAKVNEALAESFIDDAMSSVEGLEIGVYHTYSTASGDATNALLNPNIFAHPSIVTDAQSNGANKDLRLTRKTEVVPEADAGGGHGVSSNVLYTMYASPSSPIPIIRNEELLLLRAESRFNTGDVPGALADLNKVRVISGGLAPIVTAPDAAGFVDALLYERRYSLAFEGHRWIDARRLNKLDTLPLGTGFVMNVRYPIPAPECNARPGEPRCMLGSQ